MGGGTKHVGNQKSISEANTLGGDRSQRSIRLHLADLEVLLALAEEGSFSRTAERMFRTQPAVSLALKRLEDAFGAKLLERNNRRVLWTDSGRAALRCAQEVFEILKQAQQAICEQQEGKTGVLRLVADADICSYFLPEVLALFRSQNPGIRISLQCLSSARIPSAVIGDDLDFGFLSDSPEIKGLIVRSVFRDEFIWIASSTHALASLENVTWEQVETAPLVVQSPPSLCRERIEFLVSQAGARLLIGMELPDIETIKGFVVSSDCISILPWLCVRRELAQGSLRALKLKAEPIHREIRLVARQDRHCSVIGQQFLGALDQWLNAKN